VNDGSKHDWIRNDITVLVLYSTRRKCTQTLHTQRKKIVGTYACPVISLSVYGEKSKSDIKSVLQHTTAQYIDTYQYTAEQYRVKPRV
jgi:hypothetical protein